MKDVPTDLKEVLVGLLSFCGQMVIHQMMVSGLLADKLPNKESLSLHKITMHSVKVWRKELAKVGRKISDL